MKTSQNLNVTEEKRGDTETPAPAGALSKALILWDIGRQCSGLVMSHTMILAPAVSLSSAPQRGTSPCDGEKKFMIGRNMLRTRVTNAR